MGHENVMRGVEWRFGYRLHDGTHIHIIYSGRLAWKLEDADGLFGAAAHATQTLGDLPGVIASPNRLGQLLSVMRWSRCVPAASC
jgi:hypothetical protein